MNTTYLVASLYDCNNISDGLEIYKPDPFWRTTALGCKLLSVLQHMYNFEMKYVHGYQVNMTVNNTKYESPPDIFAKPLPLTANATVLAYPLHSVINRRYGFILRRIDLPVMKSYYGLPFSAETWHVFYVMIIVLLLVCYLLSKWENKVVRAAQEYTFSFELLVIVGAICQHIPPVYPILASRRIAYLALFFCSYLTYSFYTSDLLSHLVNDKDDEMTLTDLIRSSYQFITLDNLQIYTTLKTLQQSVSIDNKLINEFRKKFHKMRYLNMTGALKAVCTEEVALLSDFKTVYPYMRTDLADEVICSLTEINVLENIKEYIFTSKTFPLREEFKIGLLRIIETGIINRIKKDNTYTAPTCQHVSSSKVVFIDLVGYPLIILAFSFIISAVILMIERMHFARNRVWPFVN